MSGSDAVWPDGAREAVQEALWGNVVDDTTSCRVREATDILTALEPFVQQRIAAEVARLSTELREYQQVLRDHDNTATPGVLRGLLDQFKALRAEVARLREDGERRQAEVLQLRALLAALPIGECQASAALQGWWDQMKAVMAGTNPVWLVEPRGCPTPGACSCPGVRLDAARSAPGGEGP